MPDKHTSMGRTGRQSAEAAEKTKHDILDAALACFAHQGFTSTSLRDIAERANITHGLPRHHFGSKEELWKASTAHVLEKLEAQQIPALEEVTAETAFESFREIVRVFILSAAEYPDFWRLVAFEALKGGDRLSFIAELALPQHERIAKLFSKVQEQGHFADFDNNSFFMFVVCLGAMPFALSPLTNTLYQQDILSKDARQQHADLVLRLLFGH